MDFKVDNYDCYRIWLVAMSILSFLFWFGCGPSVIKMPGSTRMLGQPRGFEKSASSIQAVIENQSIVSAKENKENKENKGNKIAMSARSFLGDKSLKVNGNNFRYDCSGFVMAVHASVDVPISGSTKMLYDLSKTKSVLHQNKIPSNGDVAFFDNSHDRNKNGKRDDELTHIGIVEKIESDGTITLIHLGGSGIVRTYMNLHAPTTHKNADGKIINSYLRVANRKDSGSRLTGELWRAFGALHSIPRIELDA
jgi:hypothetical protein